LAGLAGLAGLSERQGEGRYLLLPLLVDADGLSRGNRQAFGSSCPHTPRYELPLVCRLQYLVPAIHRQPTPFNDVTPLQSSLRSSQFLASAPVLYIIPAPRSSIHTIIRLRVYYQHTSRTRQGHDFPQNQRQLEILSQYNSITRLSERSITMSRILTGRSNQEDSISHPWLTAA
jgi:hypothetical protein